MKKPVFVASLSLLGVALIALSSVQRRPLLIYNLSQSAAPGWYRISPQIEYDRGDMVAVSLPKWAETLAVERGYLPPKVPILKTIQAVEGDRYCVTSASISVENKSPIPILQTDSKSRVMPALPRGCRRVQAGHVLLFSTRVPSSFDSRYFGEVNAQKIIGSVVYIGTVVDSNGSEKRERGGARGPGAQGKIKGLCTKPVYDPCLHIDFYCTQRSSLAPSNCEICNRDGVEDLHQFPIIPDCSPSEQE